MLRNLLPTLLLSTLTSTALSTPLPISGYSIEMPSMGLGPSLRIATTFPANFPETAHDGALIFNCGRTLNTIASDADLKKWIASNNIKVDKTTLTVKNTRASCDRRYRLTISDPKLFSLLAPQQYDGKLYNSGRAGFLANASASEFVLEFPAHLVFTRRNNLLNVTANDQNVSVALRQGGTRMIPLSFQGKNTPARIDSKRPFSIHVTVDGGKTWQNVLIDLASPTLSFWLSSIIPDGDWPKDTSGF
jgi:hypothetical protein